jgi:hypothetical protein
MDCIGKVQDQHTLSVLFPNLLRILIIVLNEGKRIPILTGAIASAEGMNPVLRILKGTGLLHLVRQKHLTGHLLFTAQLQPDIFPMISV